MKEELEKKEVVVCSFCGKTDKYVGLMIKAHFGAAICDECVEVCNEMIEDYNERKEREEES